ncbi:16S rRNA (adenine(1518)-N(6)/adenine(1519)-N(6))-dimethyltransferase, partial [Campylobacter jejuni]|nr:16S rRNA (adenine(1518)-N(6)/adenine(1519)-N(6))-dimethyltransferase [Campylobacter jejuni]
MQTALAKVAIEPGIRAEKLTIAQMVALADALGAEKIVKK